jgi:hypothetical protein
MTLGDKVRESDLIVVNGVHADGFYREGNNLIVLYDDEGNDGRVIIDTYDASYDMTGTYVYRKDGIELRFYHLTNFTE